MIVGYCDIVTHLMFPNSVTISDKHCRWLTFRRCLTGAHFPYDVGHRKKTTVSASFERYSASLSGDRR